MVCISTFSLAFAIPFYSVIHLIGLALKIIKPSVLILENTAGHQTAT